MSFSKGLCTCLMGMSILSNIYVRATVLEPSDENTADYVVVGVGTAGGVLVKELTDDKKTSVIALHSGKNLTDKPLIKYSKNRIFTVLASQLGTPLSFDPNTLDLPQSVIDELNSLLASLPSTSPPLYQTGVTIPQVDADEQQLQWVVSLPEAGATSVNAGAWCIGTKQVYSQWEAYAGPEWSTKRILKTYRDLEHYHGKTPNPHGRGYHGPISVQQDPTPTKVAKKFTKAVIKATGFPFVRDYNNQKTPIGASSQFQITQTGHNGKFRTSSATAFLNEDVVKPNGKGVHGRKLQVMLESTALRTVWNGTTAIGVEYLQHGQTKIAYAKKGVIVCSGLKSSPFLLHSGIGSSSLLNSLGIPVVFDNPNVGQQLADQPHIVLLFSTNPKDKISNDYNSLFTQISWLPAPGADPTVREIRLSTIAPIPGLVVGVLDLVQPKSRGSVSINSSDPLSLPVIDLGLLSNSDDLTLYQNAFTTYIAAINQQLQEIDPQYQLIYPDPAILTDPTALTAFIQAEAGCNQHFQCHCRMAPQNQGGVVDGMGRVYGVQNLYVADNSIVPIAMDGSPMATAYLVGAQIARLIKESEKD